jgi:hypothetical protein
VLLRSELAAVVIGPAHLILMFWLGGAVCFAAFMFIFAKFDPEGFDRLEVEPHVVVLATAVWPYALMRAFQMIQQETQWRERRRVHAPRIQPPPPPQPCATCLGHMKVWNDEHAKLMQEHRPPEICAECLERFEAWRDKHDVPGVRCE